MKLEGFRFEEIIEKNLLNTDLLGWFFFYLQIKVLSVGRYNLSHN